MVARHVRERLGEKVGLVIPMLLKDEGYRQAPSGLLELKFLLPLRCWNYGRLSLEYTSVLDSSNNISSTDATDTGRRFTFFVV